MKPTPSDRDRISYRRAVLLVVLCLAGLSIIYLTPVREFFSVDGIERARERVESTGALAPFLFLLLNAVALTLGAPRLWFAALGGLLFGWVEGVILAETGALIGCLVTFRVSRALGQDYVRSRLGDRMVRFERLMDLIGRHGIVANLLIRSVPIGNCFAVNLFMGITPIRTSDFLIGTFLGTMPETVIYALFGSSVAGETVNRVALGLILLALLGIVIPLILRRLRQGAWGSQLESLS